MKEIAKVMNYQVPLAAEIRAQTWFSVVLGKTNRRANSGPLHENS